MSESIDGINTKYLDVFKEIGNIGAGNAATSLAKLLNRQIDMSIPEAQVVSFNSIVNILNGPETPVAGVLVDISDQLNGYILLILEVQDAMEMISLVLGQEKTKQTEEIKSLSALEQDALTEIANILVGSFLSAISSFTGLSIVPSVPHTAIDMLGAIISIAAIEYGKIGDSVLFLKTQFEDQVNEIAGHFFLIPDYNSYKILIESLGLGC